MRNITKKIISIISCAILLLTTCVVPAVADATTPIVSLNVLKEAEDNLNTAKSAVDEILTGAAFYEDFSGETQKVGYRNGSSATKVTADIAEDNGNKYGRVTVNEGHAASGYYGVLDTTPVSVNNTDNYKVVFDYKITGTVNNNIRFYRTKAGSSDGVGEGYLNATDGWSTYEYSTPKYTIDSTVFYLQITGATPVGTEICIDNFTVLTTADYERLVAAKAEYATAKAEYDEVLANLSPELLALINAEKNLNTAKSAVDEIIADAAFYEDFEGATQKVGYRNGSSATKVTADIVEDNGNKYGRVTVNEGHAASGYYGVLDTTPVSVNNTDNYKVIFDYKVTGSESDKIRFYRTSASSNSGVGTSDYLNNTDGWSTFEFSTPKYTIETTVFYLQITGATPVGTEICIDNFMVLTTADYERLVAAKAEYETAKAEYETALEEYNNNVSHVHDELIYHEKVDATCKDTGTIEYWSCSCGKLFSDADATTEIGESDLVLDKDGENHVGGTEIRDRVEATEFEAGYTGDTYCLGCGEMTEKGIIIEATGSALGDVNSDGKINNKDIGILMQYINGWKVEINLDACDVNLDTKINNKDYVLIMRFINGWDIKFEKN